jgi:hypothetical protein
MICTADDNDWVYVTETNILSQGIQDAKRFLTFIEANVTANKHREMGFQTVVVDTHYD